MRPPRFLPAGPAVAALALAVALAGCGSASRSSTAPTVAPSAPATGAGPTATATPLTTAAGSGPGHTVPVTAPAPAPVTGGGPTVAPYVPSAPQASPDAAAGALVRYWAAADRAGASSVAAPAAVSALFANAYPAGYLQARGCTDASTDPGTCTYRNTATDGIYQFGVSRAAGGWYVTAVTPES